MLEVNIQSLFSSPPRCAEVLILILFVLLALLWLTREPRFIPGWGKIFEIEESGKRYTTTLCILYCNLQIFVVTNFSSHGSGRKFVYESVY